MNIPGDYWEFAYHLPKPGERLSDQRAGDTVRASALVAAEADSQANVWVRSGPRQFRL